MRLESFIFILFSSFLTATAHSETCSEIFPVNLTMVDDGKEVIAAGPTYFRYRDLTYGFFFEANVDNGVLNINPQLTQGQFISPHSYEKLYDIMVLWIDLSKVKAILEIWEGDTNAVQFYKTLEHGSSPTDAALLTEAGQQAARHGFAEIRSLRYFPGATTDAPLSIEVEFVRPKYFH